jgi:hypothetical protein
MKQVDLKIIMATGQFSDIVDQVLLSLKVIDRDEYLFGAGHFSLLVAAISFNRGNATDVPSQGGIYRAFIAQRIRTDHFEIASQLWNSQAGYCANSGTTIIALCSDKFLTTKVAIKIIGEKSVRVVLRLHK